MPGRKGVHMSDTISGLNSSYLNGTYTNSTTSALESTLNNKDLSTSSSDELMEVCKDFEEYFAEQMVKSMLKMAKVDSRNRAIYTDSLGNFEITSMTGGIFGCPKISLSLEKEGYNKVKKKYKCCTGNVVIALERQAEGKTEKR